MKFLATFFLTAISFIPVTLIYSMDIVLTEQEQSTIKAIDDHYVIDAVVDGLLSASNKNEQNKLMIRRMLLLHPMPKTSFELSKLLPQLQLVARALDFDNVVSSSPLQSHLLATDMYHWILMNQVLLSDISKLSTLAVNQLFKKSQNDYFSIVTHDESVRITVSSVIANEFPYLKAARSGFRETTQLKLAENYSLDTLLLYRDMLYASYHCSHCIYKDRCNGDEAKKNMFELFMLDAQKKQVNLQDIFNLALLWDELNIVESVVNYVSRDVEALKNFAKLIEPAVLENLIKRMPDLQAILDLCLVYKVTCFGEKKTSPFTFNLKNSVYNDYNYKVLPIFDGIFVQTSVANNLAALLIYSKIQKHLGALNDVSQVKKEVIVSKARKYLFEIIYLAHCLEVEKLFTTDRLAAIQMLQDIYATVLKHIQLHDLDRPSRSLHDLIAAFDQTRMYSCFLRTPLSRTSLSLPREMARQSAIIQKDCVLYDEYTLPKNYDALVYEIMQGCISICSYMEITQLPDCKSALRESLETLIYHYASSCFFNDDQLLELANTVGNKDITDAVCEFLTSSKALEMVLNEISQLSDVQFEVHKTRLFSKLSFLLDRHFPHTLKRKQNQHPFNNSCRLKELWNTETVRKRIEPLLQSKKKYALKQKDIAQLATSESPIGCFIDYYTVVFRNNDNIIEIKDLYTEKSVKIRTFDGNPIERCQLYDVYKLDNNRIVIESSRMDRAEFFNIYNWDTKEPVSERTMGKSNNVFLCNAGEDKLLMVTLDNKLVLGDLHHFAKTAHIISDCSGEVCLSDKYILCMNYIEETEGVTEYRKSKKTEQAELILLGRNSLTIVKKFPVKILPHCKPSYALVNDYVIFGAEKDVLMFFDIKTGECKRSTLPIRSASDYIVIVPLPRSSKLLLYNAGQVYLYDIKTHLWQKLFEGKRVMRKRNCIIPSEDGTNFRLLLEDGTIEEWTIEGMKSLCELDDIYLAETAEQDSGSPSLTAADAAKG